MSINWARLSAVMALVLSGAVYAQSANEMVSPLQACSQSTRLAHEACRREADPERRLACVHNVSATQLECLERSLPQGPPPSEDTSKAPPMASSASAASSVPRLNGEQRGPARTEQLMALPKGVATAAGEKEPLAKSMEAGPVAAELSAIARAAGALATAKEGQKPGEDQTNETLGQPDHQVAEPAMTSSVLKRTKTSHRKGSPPCTQFRTYNAASGSYRAYDGKVRECRRSLAN
jgi:hypothetical protein